MTMPLLSKWQDPNHVRHLLDRQTHCFDALPPRWKRYMAQVRWVVEQAMSEVQIANLEWVPEYALGYRLLWEVMRAMPGEWFGSEIAALLDASVPGLVFASCEVTGPDVLGQSPRAIRVVSGQPYLRPSYVSRSFFLPGNPSLFPELMLLRDFIEP